MTVSAQLPSDTPKYQLLMEIGRGGMGVVYLAMARGPRGFVKLVVLKTLQPQLVDNDGACRMFLDEARILARLAHPNIVQVFEVIQHLGLPAMVMEYMEGRPLSAVLDPDPVPLPRVMYLYAICKVLAGLHAAHELRDYDGRALNLIHRDVSPHNVFLMFSGQVKVLDFGIAKLADSNGETQTGELKGKIRYMAPEQIGGDRLDRRVDIFAAGIMLWEALAGARLWSDLSETEVLRRLINGEIPPLPERDDIPASFAKLCEKALAFDPNRRFATASEFQRELEGHLGELPEVGKEESLSAFMLEHFGRERDATNRVIETQIKVAQRHETNGPPGYEPPSVGNMANGKPTMGKIPRLLWFSAIVAVTVVALGIFSAANRPLLSETPERPGTEKPTEPRT
ncbi:MAG TPA: serine/threonine-protein kinase, partial [Polyangiaceae bacterium]